MFITEISLQISEIMGNTSALEWKEPQSAAYSPLKSAQQADSLMLTDKLTDVHSQSDRQRRRGGK